MLLATAAADKKYQRSLCLSKPATEHNRSLAGCLYRPFAEIAKDLSLRVEVVDASQGVGSTAPGNGKDHLVQLKPVG